MPKPNPNTPCLNCTERWIDTKNNKRCHDTCDRHLQNIAKKKNEKAYMKVDWNARVMYIKPKSNRVLANMINEERRV